jgi:hypothetical protein
VSEPISDNSTCVAWKNCSSVMPLNRRGCPLNVPLSSLSCSQSRKLSAPNQPPRSTNEKMWRSVGCVAINP